MALQVSPHIIYESNDSGVQTLCCKQPAVRVRRVVLILPELWVVRKDREASQDRGAQSYNCIAPSLPSPKLIVFVEDDQSLKGTSLQLCVTQLVS